MTTGDGSHLFKNHLYIVIILWGLGLSSKSNYIYINSVCEGFGPLDRFWTLGCKEVRLDTFTQCKSLRSQNFMQRIPAKLLHHRSQAQNDLTPPLKSRSWDKRITNGHLSQQAEAMQYLKRVRCSGFNWRLSTSPKLHPTEGGACDWLSVCGSIFPAFTQSSYIIDDVPKHVIYRKYRRYSDLM